MANHILTCKLCKLDFQVNFYSYPKILLKFDARTVEEVNRYYLCQQCRVYEERMSKCNIDKTRIYREAKYNIQTEVNLYKKRGLDNPDARNNFMVNVKSILDKCKVTCYSYFIVDNKLQGIKIQIPFMGEILMKLNSDK